MVTLSILEGRPSERACNPRAVGPTLGDRRRGPSVRDAGDDDVVATAKLESAVCARASGRCVLWPIFRRSLPGGRSFLHAREDWVGTAPRPAPLRHSESSWNIAPELRGLATAPPPNIMSGKWLRPAGPLHRRAGRKKQEGGRMADLDWVLQGMARVGEAAT